MTPTAPLLLELIQETPHEPFRLVTDGDDYVLEALVLGTWRALYRFDLTIQQPADYELSNFWVCHHPTSHFISGLNVARVEPGRRYALRDNCFTIYPTGSPGEERIVTSVRELRELLDQTFYITIPTIVDVNVALQALLVEQ